MNKGKKIELSIILACYNEMQILHKSIFELIEFLDNTKLNYEIIMIDDCSKDGTNKELPKLAKKYPQIKFYLHKKNIGRGGTVSEGLKLAKGQVIGFLDIDLETPPWYISPAYMYIKKGYDLVIAYRIHKLDIRIIIRTILSREYNFLVRNILKIPFPDTEAGFKFFNRKKILPILKETKDKGWFWDTEVITRAYYKKHKIKMLPTLFIRKPSKTSTVKVFSDSLDYFKKLLRFRKEIKRMKNE